MLLEVEGPAVYGLNSEELRNVSAQTGGPMWGAVMLRYSRMWYHLSQPHGEVHVPVHSLAFASDDSLLFLDDSFLEQLY